MIKNGVKRLDKSRPYRRVYKDRKPFLVQDEKLFTCGGYPIVNGEPVGIILQPAEINAKNRHDIQFNATKTAAEAAADAERMVNEMRGISFPCPVCDKEYKERRWFDRHMKTVHPGHK